jgi:alpha-galactosidase/6-phospho-beta-glucosidase family protein
LWLAKLTDLTPRLLGVNHMLWQVRVADGKQFYINHDTQTTTSVHPHSVKFCDLAEKTYVHLQDLFVLLP